MSSKKACNKYGWVIIADPAVSHSDNAQSDKSKAQRKTRKAAASAENATPTALPASRTPPVPPDRLLEHMLTLELGEAKMRDEGYRSGIAARTYGKSREATVAARVVEMSVRELEVELDKRLTEEDMKYGCSHDDYEAFMGAGMRRVRAQVAASVDPEHRRLDRPVVHDLHAAALMLLAQLEADSSAAGDSRPEKPPSETRKAPANSALETSETASKELAASQLPSANFAAGAGKRTEGAVGSQEACLTSNGQVAGSHSSPGRVLSLSTSAAGVGKGPEGVSGRPASGQRGESKAAFGAVLDMLSTGTQQSPGQVSESRATSVESTGDPSTEASAQRALSQPVACDESLHQLPPPPEGAVQAASHHSSDSQDASQSAASCAERSGSSSIASGAAAIPQGSMLTSGGQAAGSHSSPGRASSPPCFCTCLPLSLPEALIRPLAHHTVTKQHLRRKGCR